MTQTEILDQLRRLLAEYMGSRLPPTPLPDDADIRDYGVDSLDFLEFFAEIERHFAIKLPAEEIDLSRHNTLQEITTLVVAKVKIKSKL